MAALGNRSMWTVSVTASFLLHAGLALTFATVISSGNVPPRETRISMETVDPGLPLGDTSEPARRDAVTPEPPRSADPALQIDDTLPAASSSTAETESEAVAVATAPEPDKAMPDVGVVPPAERPADDASVTPAMTPESALVDGGAENLVAPEPETASAAASAEVVPLTEAAGEVRNAGIPGEANTVEASATAEAAAPIVTDASLSTTEPSQEAVDPPASVDVATGNAVDAPSAASPESQEVATADRAAVGGDLAPVEPPDAAETVPSASGITDLALPTDAAVPIGSAANLPPAEPSSEAAEVSASDVVDATSAAPTEPQRAATDDLAAVTVDLGPTNPVGASDTASSVSDANSAAETPSAELPEPAIGGAEPAVATDAPIGAVAARGPAEAVGPAPVSTIQTADSPGSDLAADSAPVTPDAARSTVEVGAVGLATVMEAVSAPPPPEGAIVAPSDEPLSSAADETEVAVAVGAQIGAAAEVGVLSADRPTSDNALPPANEGPVTELAVDAPPITAEAATPIAADTAPGSVAVAESAALDGVASAEAASLNPAVAASDPSGDITPSPEEVEGRSLTSESVLDAFASSLEEASSVGNGAAPAIVGAGGESLEASSSEEAAAPPTDAASPVETALLSPGSSTDALATPFVSPAIEPDPIPQPPGGEGVEKQTSDLPADPTPPATPPQDAAAETRRALQTRIASVVDYLAGYEGGNCFVAFPELNSRGDLRLSAFAADISMGSDLSARLSSTVGFDVPVTTNAISQPQCSALRFTQLIGDARARRPIRIVLDRADVANGEALSGRILGGAGEPIHLLIVDDEGAVQNVDRYVSQDGNGITFDPPVFLTGGAVSTVQLLVAVAAREELDTIVRLRKTEADGFFSMLTSEMRNMQLKATIAVAAFNVR